MQRATCQAPDISIIVPVLGEQKIINNLIEELRRIDPAGQTEIIVVDGDPDGGTIGSVKDRDAVTLKAPAGRASQMNTGAKLAKGEILLFLHADTRIPPDGLKEIKKGLADGRCVAGAFDLGIDAPRWVYRLIERFASARSRITRVPFGDQAIFARRDYFSAHGGFPDLPLMEDVRFMSRIRARGDRIVILRERTKTSPRRWEKNGVLLYTLKNWYIQVLYLLGVAPERLARFYR